MKSFFLGLLAKLFGRNDWTTVDPNEECKEWLEVKNPEVI
jgi:hypothetical protein